MTTGPFKVTWDNCAVTLHYLDLEVAKRDLKKEQFGYAADLTPAQARELAAELIDKAEDCEDAQEHELEQMR